MPIVALTMVGAGEAQSSRAAYRAPRTLDGQPDLQGVWQAVNTAALRLGLCVVAIIVFQEDGSAEAARELLETSAQPAADTCQ